MLSTLGMPTRSVERSLRFALVAAEAFLPNHVGNVGKSMLRLLDSGLDDLHFVQIFHQPLRTRIIYDHPLPARAQRNLAPRTSLALKQCHINKTALAVDRTPVANRVHRSRSLVSEFFDRIESAKHGAAAVLPPIQCDQASPDRPRFPGVRMNHDIRIRNFVEYEIHLG